MSPSARHLTPLALARLLGDWREGVGPLYAKLALRLGQLLADGRVAPGVRLPAERRLAAELGHSRTTVVRAYAQLREQGLLESRQGAGSVSRLGDTAAERFVAWSGAVRLGGRGQLIDLAKAAPRADDHVIAALRQAAAEAEGHVAHDGYHTLGLGQLREAIASRYEARGVPTTSEQIIVTNGAQQAVDLVARSLVRAREAVVVESPTYPGALDSLRLAGARLITLDVAAETWSLETFEGLIQQTGARLAYLVVDYHNPTGRSMDDAARERLVLLCRRYGVILIIDETLADVVVEPGPAASPVAAHEPSGAVLSIGSLSKSVWPGLRVGWIRASPAQIGALAALRATNDLGGPVVEQLAGAALVPDQERIAAARQPLLRAQRDALIAAAAALGWRTETPRGGLATWVELPTGSSSLLADVAYRRGVVVIPGPRFSADGALDRYLRLPYTLPEETIRAAMERLALAWEEAQNGPVVEPARLQVV